MALQPRPANRVEALSRLYYQFNPNPPTPRPVAYSRKGMSPEVVAKSVRSFINANKDKKSFQDDIKYALDEIFDLPTPSPQSLDKAAQIEAKPLSEEQAYEILERFMGECVKKPALEIVDTVQADQSPSPDAQYIQDPENQDPNPSLATPKPTASKSKPKNNIHQADPNEINSNPGELSTESNTWVLDAVLRIRAEVTSDNLLGNSGSINVIQESTERKEASQEAVEANQATTIPRPEPQPQAKHQEKAKPKHTAEKFIEHAVNKSFESNLIKDAMRELKPQL